jgi:hypothetical protein
MTDWKIFHEHIFPNDQDQSCNKTDKEARDFVAFTAPVCRLLRKKLQFLAGNTKYLV